jgi:hypothetical protein
VQWNTILIIARFHTDPFYGVVVQWVEIWNAYTYYEGSRVSSGSIVSDYGLDDRAIGVRSPAGAKDFSSSLFVQTGSGAYPASCPMGTGGPFPGGKARPGRDADHLPHLVPRSWMSRSYTSSPPQVPPWRVTGLLYFTFFLRTMERSYNIPIKSTKRLVQRFQNCGAPPRGGASCLLWVTFIL